MHVAILTNPASGRGRSLVSAAALSRALGPSSRIVHSRAGNPAETAAYLEAELGGMGACVVVGGDGTVQGALPALMRTGVPVYHLGCGTENLFARHFKMPASVQAAQAAVAARCVQAVDVGSASWSAGTRRLFSLMCSIGPDAGVTRRLAAVRTGAIRHGSYVRPALGEFARPSLPRMRVEVDGKEVVSDRRGWLVLANSPWYGLGINPGRRAIIDDGVLDVVFFPAEGSVGALGWFVASKLGRHMSDRRVVYVQGRDVRVWADEWVVQTDGDWVPGLEGRAGAASETLSASVLPRAVNVLLPA